MRRVAVIGVGVTKFGRHDRTSAELFAEAAADALADAGLPASAVQALYYGNVVGGETEKQLHTGPQAASVLGLPAIPTTRVENACASSHTAFRHAVMEVAAGVSDVVLVGGAERVLHVPTADSTEYFAYCSDASWEQPLGLTFPGVFALVARAHMAKYGTTEEQMAAVAVKNHRHGVHNPKAQFQKEITLEQVMKSAYVADPLKLYDCCPFTDGGAALVLVSEEVARRSRRPVWVLASAAASDWMLLGDKRDLSRVPATERAAAAAYRQAGLRPADVDVVELHDCFTIAEIVATEGLGLFEPGSGAGAAERGDTSLGGKIPVNPSGGLKAKGHPIGATGA
ncbi:MAG: thiolase domain-containing protein, partial [Candidatus Rokubacteria bacterium]|nr:thiolase domain-containing protein [Candidatus Rokubacteria bacterium]